MADIKMMRTEYIASLAADRAYYKAKRRGKSVEFCRRFAEVIRIFFLSNPDKAEENYIGRRRK